MITWLQIVCFNKTNNGGFDEKGATEDIEVQNRKVRLLLISYIKSINVYFTNVSRWLYACIEWNFDCRETNINEALKEQSNHPRI